MQAIVNWIKGLDPVGRDTHPNLACAIGLLFGGVGLAIYFRTFVDLLVPVAISLIALATVPAIGGFGLIAGALVAALYGYQRASTSNANRMAGHPNVPAAVAG